jgi:ribosomal protein S18 acetylase RimI-like enzyme
VRSALRYAHRLPAGLFHPPSPVTLPGAILFRLAHRDDFQGLYDSCYPGELRGEIRDRFLRSVERQSSGLCYHLLALHQNGAGSHVAGSGRLLMYPHGAEIADLIVTPAARNKGIGTSLIHILTAIAAHLDVGLLEIGVVVDNHRARALYERLGFREERRIRLPGDEPAIIMTKALS